jgi:hypothetical protein
MPSVGYIILVKPVYAVIIKTENAIEFARLNCFHYWQASFQIYWLLDMWPFAAIK